MFKCPYCDDRRKLDDDHSCEGLRRMQARLSAILGDIKADQLMPNSKPETSLQIKARADRRKSMATQLKIRGIEVRDEYR